MIGSILGIPVVQLWSPRVLVVEPSVDLNELCERVKRGVRECQARTGHRPELIVLGVVR